MQEGNTFIPWYNDQLVDFLSAYLKEGMEVFEYGCGYSTLFYAQKSCNVYASETRQEWVTEINTIAQKNNLINNINIQIIHPTEFPQSILCNRVQYNVIAVDSIRRLECLKCAKSSCNGIIILDNSERENLQQADCIMQGFQYKVFEGRGVNREGTSQAKVYTATEIHCL
ncbi:MAG: hypothetical protein ACI9CD_000176 [Candidatus Deianiraeaceae bacterium]|jgi:hypothetical protein